MLYPSPKALTWKTFRTTVDIILNQNQLKVVFPYLQRHKLYIDIDTNTAFCLPEKYFPFCKWVANFITLTTPFSRHRPIIFDCCHICSRYFKWKYLSNTWCMLGCVSPTSTPGTAQGCGRCSLISPQIIFTFLQQPVGGVYYHIYYQPCPIQLLEHMDRKIILDNITCGLYRIICTGYTGYVGHRGSHPKDPGGYCSPVAHN